METLSIKSIGRGYQKRTLTSQGQTVGKAKRIRATLQWAFEHELCKGEQLVSGLISHIRGCGGFRQSSSNYVGAEAIENAVEAFRTEGFDLGADGHLQPFALDGLDSADLTEASSNLYIRRARRGIQDAALVAGTGKDLVEAVAAHVLMDQIRFLFRSLQAFLPFWDKLSLCWALLRSKA